MADYDSMIAGMDDADANLAGAQGVKPSAAIVAFKAAPRTGVSPSLGMTDPHLDSGVSDLQAAQDIMGASPAVRSFASTSPAHVAATQEDFPNLAKVGFFAQRWRDATAPFAEGLDNFKRMMELGATSAGGGRENPLSLLPKAPEGAEKELLQRADALSVLGLLTSLPNVVSAPAARGYVGLVGPAAGQTREEAVRQVTGGLNVAGSALLPAAVSGIGRIKVPVRPGVQDLGMATEVGGTPRLTGPREVVPDAEFTPVKPPGVAPDDAAVYKGAAEMEVFHAEKLQESIAGTQTHALLPSLTEEFLSHTPVAGQTVWVDPEAILKLYAEGHQPFPQYAQAIGAALNSGRDIALPAEVFHTEVAGKPYADALNAAARFREGGVSVDEAKALGDGGAEGGEPVRVQGGEGGDAVAPREVVPPEDIPPEMHEGVRTLAATAVRATEEVFKELALSQLFDPKALKLTKGRFENYDAMLAEAKAATSERILQRTYDQIRRERTPEWKDRVARHAATVEDALVGNRAIAARQELQYAEGPKGEPLDRGLKLSRAAVTEEYGPSVANSLPRTMFSPDGVAADDAAPLLGYDTGAELLSDLLDLEAAREHGGFPSSRAHLKDLIHAEATSLARSELGYDISPEGLARAARESAVLPSIEGFLDSGLRALGEEIGAPPFDKEGVKSAARVDFNRLSVADARNPRAFERGMWKTGEKAAKALEKGDFPAAFLARQQQLLNFYQLEMSHFLAKKVAKSNKDWARWGRKPTIKGLSQPFLNQLHAYLPEFGFRVNREPQELAEALGGVTLPQFVDAIIETDAAFPSVPEVEPAPVDTLAVEDYWTVRGFIYAMSRYGRELQTARTAEKRDAREGVIEAAIAGAPPGKPPREARMGGEKSLPEKVKSGFLRYDAAHRKVADMVEWFDKGDPLGLWAENITLPMYAGADAEGALHRDTYTPVVRAWEAIPDVVKRGYNARLPSVGGVQAYRKHIPVLALYAGTQESLDKAAGGFGLEPQAYLDFINAYITPEEVALVTMVWEKFEELAPRVSEELRALTGQGLRRVEPQAVELGGVRTAGGYWPIKYDRQLNRDVAMWEREREATLSPDGVDQLFGDLLPNKGFSEERTNYVGPVDVALGNIAHAFDSHIKYAAYARAVSDVRKFTYDPRILGTIERVMGVEYTEVIPGWLDGVVKPYQAPESLLRPIEGWFNSLGRRMTVGTLALSYGTLISQTAGVMNAVAALSDKSPVEGLVRLAGGYGLALQQVGRFHEMFARSEMMRQRYGALEQNMTEALMETDALDPAHIGLRKNLKHLERLGFHMIGWVEFATVSGPQWLAAEQKALEQGMTPERAVLYANRLVVKAQGAGRKVDLSAVQRAQGMWKLMYAFQSYFNQQYQWGVDVFRNFSGGGMEPPLPPQGAEGDIGDAPTPAARYSRSKGLLILFTVFILAGVLDNWLRGRKQKPTDPLFNFLRPMFGVNTLANFADRHIDFKDGKVVVKNTYDTDFGDDLFSRAGEIIGQNVLLLTKLGKTNKDGSPKSLGRPVQTVASLGQMAGIPGSAQVGRTGEYLYELSTGKQVPRSDHEWSDLYHGLTGGPRPEQTHKASASRSQQ